METKMNGKTAVITGGGGGIGRAVALRLAREGMNIVLLGGNNRQKLEETRSQIAGFAPCLAIPGNLPSLLPFTAELTQAADAFGGIDVLVNNAGMTLNSPLEATSEEEFDAIMAVNIKVPYFLTSAALPYLRRSDAASIINIASVVAHAGYIGQSAYGASKHALLGFTKSIAAELYQEGIRVHAIAPGGVYTDMVKIARPDLSPDGMIMPDDIAGIVWFFLANRSNAVVDEIIVHRVNKQPFLV